MPCDYSKYPENWFSEIRPDILKRDNNKCKFCGVENYSLYEKHERYIIIYDDSLESYSDALYLKQEFNNPNIKIIVLTIAHLDHDIENNDYSNLAALCQRCHLTHDARQHLNKRKENRLQGQLKLFE